MKQVSEQLDWLVRVNALKRFYTYMHAIAAHGLDINSLGLPVNRTAEKNYFSCILFNLHSTEKSLK